MSWVDVMSKVENVLDIHSYGQVMPLLRCLPWVRFPASTIPNAVLMWCPHSTYASLVSVNERSQSSSTEHW